MLQQQPLYLHPTTSSPNKEEYSSLHSSPSSHSLLDPKSLRFEVVMEAPTAAAQKVNESPLTYLNKGQAYNITLKDTQQAETYLTSTIMIMFHDEDHRKTAPNYWKFWQTQQSNPQMARAIDIEHTKSSGIYQVECHTFDRITFRWLGNKGGQLLIRFNCLSTDFSRIKGVKGIPLRLHMETSVGGEIERSYCRIKLFRDKGAERKNKDDAKNIERQLEKLRGKHGEPHPLWLTYSHAVPYTVFNKVDAQEVATLYNDPVRYPSSPPIPTSYMPLTSSPIVPSTSTSSQQKRHYRYLTDPGYPLQPQHAHTLFQPPPPPPPLMPPMPFATTSHPWISSPVDVDPDYTPQKRHRAAKRSLFVRFDPQPTYRAIYLNELTVHELKTKLILKMNDPDVKGEVMLVRRVANKQPELLVCIDEDAVVQDMPEEQDMVIQKKRNEDGSITLRLLY